MHRGGMHRGGMPPTRAGHEATCDMRPMLALEVSLPAREPSHELRLLDAERLQGLPRELALTTARAAARGTAPTTRGDADAAGGAASGAAGGGAAGGAMAVAPASAVLRGRGEEAA